MFKYTIKRLFQSLLTVLLVISAVFLLLRLLPTEYFFTEEQNIKLTEEQKAWGTQGTPALSSKLNTKAVVVDNAKATWKAASLVLNNGVTIRFRFAAESTEGLTVKIVAAGQEWTVSQFTAAEQAGQYYADFSGLSARQMREVVSVTVMEGDTAVSNTLEYSVETYAYNKQNEARIGDLVLAMMRYGDSAAAYLN